ncbi:RNA-binding protein [Agrobacterium rosae]|uniref:DNA-binding protein n=2 Tax=Agrobacterium rosae TaxID=1972867 RepID=A0AAE5S1D6_9HYPH|nr:RNA-binding protein [Agrobacterium rosae]KAA3511125.1 RNA-binding protein [Agrobacterium rosae]KAA3518163.1 RNA-binding protein [Agrobacterium rosae]MCM2434472.1 RNA-binding protein [Agrobacterium rosae]MQB49754.1 RNA-binding protein [Agrobacterium rosae]POO53996.1 DNA-binding protein [Agrobacterium rosae]
MMSQAHQPDELFDDEQFEGTASERMCIVTRQIGSPDELIRFVAGPDQSVVPDLKRQLPGRGCWVTPERALIEKAIAKKLFARALKTDVKAGPDLLDMMDRLMAQQLAGMISMARKASQFISGATKVDAAVRSGKAIAVFHATDAAPDGVRKINQARKAWTLGSGAETEIPSFRLFSEQEMDELMGQNAFIHACVLAGQAGEGVVKRAKMLERYRNGDQPQADLDAARTEQ